MMIEPCGAFNRTHLALRWFHTCSPSSRGAWARCFRHHPKRQASGITRPLFPSRLPELTGTRNQFRLFGLRVREKTRPFRDPLRDSQLLTRAKNGTPATHPVRGPEIRALRRLQRDYPVTPYVFVTERGGPLTESTVRKMVVRAGREAGIPFPVHPHMLRHACGFKLANDGHDTRAIQHYLGHRQIQHTVRYTELSGTRFNGFWKD